MKYDKGYLDNSDTNFLDAQIYDSQYHKHLSAEEIVKLQLFINPIDQSVWYILNREMVKSNIYEYEIY